MGSAKSQGGYVLGGMVILLFVVALSIEMLPYNKKKGDGSDKTNVEVVRIENIVKGLSTFRGTER